MAAEATEPMADEDWSSLAYSIEQGYCILMLGPDAITEPSDGGRRPVINRLSRELLSLTDDPDRFDETDFRSIAQAAMAKDLFAFRSKAVAALKAAEIRDPILTSLAALPFELIINTAPGLRVDEVWRAAKPGTETDYYRFRPPLMLDPIPEPTVDKPLVYDLYGSLADPQSLALTDSELIALLVAVVSETPDLPSNLKSVLRDPERTFLFLGFRLHLWHLRILLHVLAASDPKSHSYALQAINSVDAGTQQFYREGHKIKFCDFGVEDFVAQLTSRIEVAPAGTTGDRPTRQAPPAKDRTVFICHAGEDAKYARDMNARLRAAGFETWLDKQSLRGGDRWDTEIKRAIDEVRYVVVLQSAHLKARQEGYVNKEINLALERQLEFRSDLAFIIPTVIDDSANILDDFRDLRLQSIKLYEPDGFEQLRRALVRDGERADKK